MSLTLMEALTIVYDLANENALGEFEAEQYDLEDERAEQQAALEVVQDEITAMREWEKKRRTHEDMAKS